MNDMVLKLKEQLSLYVVFAKSPALSASMRDYYTGAAAALYDLAIRCSIDVSEYDNFFSKY